MWGRTAPVYPAEQSVESSLRRSLLPKPCRGGTAPAPALGWAATLIPDVAIEKRAIKAKHALTADFRSPAILSAVITPP